MIPPVFVFVIQETLRDSSEIFEILMSLGAMSSETPMLKRLMLIVITIPETTPVMIRRTPKIVGIFPPFIIFEYNLKSGYWLG